MAAGNRKHEVACNATSNTCTLDGLSPGTEYTVYMQAFVPITGADAEHPVASELSEPLIMRTVGEGEYAPLMYAQCLHTKKWINMTPQVHFVDVRGQT